MKWDGRVHEDILLAVCKQVNFTSDQYALIMDELRAQGYEFTEGALRYIYALWFIPVLMDIVLFSFTFR